MKNNYTDLQKQTPKNFSKAVINEAILKEPYKFAAIFETVGIFLVFSAVCILFIGVYAFLLGFRITMQHNLTKIAHIFEKK
ncbi:MAG: hypothetical protein L6V95_13820 [Candidatus Melainabacteria bacterium]|nr:MAG: hypothetical protein L6V95_13820 [Candidatus Melainabacteria bacterium]